MNDYIHHISWEFEGVSGEFLLEGPEITIGRGQQCQLILDNRTVSRNHARMVYRDESWYIIDLGSSYGSTLDGHPLEKLIPKRIYVGAQLRLGDQELVLHGVHDAQENLSSLAEYEPNFAWEQFNGQVHQLANEAFGENKADHFGEKLDWRVASFKAQIDAEMNAHLALHEFANLISQSLDLNEILDRALSLMANVLHADRALILKFDEEQNHFATLAAKKFVKGQANFRRENIDYPKLMAMRCFKENEILLGNRAPDDLPTQVQALVFVPITRMNKVTGVIYLANTEPMDAFWQEHLFFLRLFGIQIGNALYNSHLYLEAITDELTGLFLRKYMNRQLSNEMKRCLRYGRTFSVMLIALDQIQRIHRDYGQEFTDLILNSVGNLFRLEVRDTDVPGRFDREHLWVILPESNGEETGFLAKRLRQKIAALRFEHQLEDLRVSIGILEYDKTFGVDQERMIETLQFKLEIGKGREDSQDDREDGS